MGRTGNREQASAGNGQYQAKRRSDYDADDSDDWDAGQPSPSKNTIMPQRSRRDATASARAQRSREKASPSGHSPIDARESIDSTESASTSSYSPTPQQTSRSDDRQLVRANSVRGQPGADSVSTDSSDEATDLRGHFASRSRHASPKSVRSARSTRSRRMRAPLAAPDPPAQPPIGSPAYSESSSQESTPESSDEQPAQGIEVEILDAEDEVVTGATSRISSRGGYRHSRAPSPVDGGRYRTRRPRHSLPYQSEDETSHWRRHSPSDFDRSAPRSTFTRPASRSASRSIHRSASRNLDRSASRSAPRSASRSAPVSRAASLYESPPRISRPRVTNVMTESRPPVTSRRSPGKSTYQSAEVVYHDSRPRKSTPMRSHSHRSHSSSTRRPTSVFGGLFGVPSRPSRPEMEEPVEKVQCVACMSHKRPYRAPQLACGHRMCRSCLKQLFEMSITDPQHMPPKCCTSDYIPLEHVAKIFDDSFKRQWNRKFKEYSTRNRIYCPAKRCGEWIKPSNITKEHGRKMGRCGKCRTKVCAACNGKWHSSPDCPTDEQTCQLLEQAKTEGWQRCYRCKAMVELKEGCNHMTCRCTAEFCMICGSKWKTCDCPWFNYDGNEAELVDYLPQELGAAPHIRGDLGDIFDGEGPPMPGELHGHLGYPPATPRRVSRPLPHSYDEEMFQRRLQEEQDLDLARRMQLYDDFEEERAPDPRREAFGVGNASGHYMNDHYNRERPARRAHRRSGGGVLPEAPAPPPPVASSPLERGTAYMNNVSRARGVRSGSMERRLAGRLSGERHGSGRVVPPHSVPHPMGSMMPSATASPPLVMDHGFPPDMPAVRTTRSQAPLVRPRTFPDGVYDTVPAVMHSGRSIVPRSSKYYIESNEDEDEMEYYSGSRRGVVEGPRSSTLAGLTGHGRGMNRVREWIGYIEPGVPEDIGSVTSH